MYSCISVAIMENLEKQLKNFKGIRPNPEYAEKSRMLILASKQKPETFRKFGIFEFLRTSIVIGVGLFLLVMLVGGTFYINKNYSPLTLDGLNRQSLITEAEEIDASLQTTLGQIKYLDQLNQKALETIEQVVNEKISASSTEQETINKAGVPEEATSTVDEINAFFNKKPNSTDTESDGINKILDKLSQ